MSNIAYLNYQQRQYNYNQLPDVTFASYFYLYRIYVITYIEKKHTHHYGIKTFLIPLRIGNCKILT